METEITLSTILEAVDGVKTLVENSEETDLSEVLKELDNIETDLSNWTRHCTEYTVSFHI